jgi:hypothetical protein
VSSKADTLGDEDIAIKNHARESAMAPAATPLLCAGDPGGLTGLSDYELIERVRQTSPSASSMRDYLAIEIMAAYLLMAADPTNLRRKCYQVADDLIANRPRW